VRKDFSEEIAVSRKMTKKEHLSLTAYARKNIREIHALSEKYNGKRGKHAEKLLSLVREHAREITKLHIKKDPHFLIETGDLMVLCLELLAERKGDADGVMEKCYERYKKKLGGLIKKNQAGLAKGGKR
jgi:hypothetical protein